MKLFRINPKLFVSLFFLFSLINSQYYSQDLDSLIQIAEGMDENGEKAELLIDITYEHSNRALYNDGIQYADAAIKLCQKLGDKTNEANATKGLGDIYISLRKFNDASILLQKSKAIYKSLGDESGIANVNSSLGELFAWKGESDEDYLKAKEYLFEAISYRLENKQFKELASNYFELAIIYDSQTNPAKTLEYYYKVIEICRDKRYVKNIKSNRLAAAYANSGAVYRDARENGLAIEYYFKALESLPDNGNLSNKAIMNRELGLLHRRIGDYEASATYLFNSMHIGNSLENNWRVQEAHQNLGHLHLDQNNLDSASFYLDKSLNLSKSLDWNLSASFSLLGDYFYAIEDYSQAIHHYLKSIGENRNYTSSYKGIAKCYKSKGNYLKSTEYLELYQFKKDSISELMRIPALSLNDTKQEQDLSFKETKRIEEEEKKAVQERNYLQYSAAMLAIIILLLLLNLVVSFKLPPIAIKGMAFITILSLFEFTLVYLDPHIETFTDSEPLYKLGINVFIAALIFPVHTFIEKKMSKNNS
jgi:tetratricopeptide (TPR) repeat protein